MYKKLLVPVDLNHPRTLKKSLCTAAALAKTFDAVATLFHVGGTGLGRPAERPEFYAEQLRVYAEEQSEALSCAFAHVSVVSDDPAAEFPSRLRKEIAQGGYDLLVMSSHEPGLAEHIFASQGGWFASHAKISVCVVRD